MDASYMNLKFLEKKEKKEDAERLEILNFSIIIINNFILYFFVS